MNSNIAKPERFEKSIYKRGQGLEIMLTSDDYNDGKVFQLWIHSKDGGCYARMTKKEMEDFLRIALVCVLAEPYVKS